LDFGAARTESPKISKLRRCLFHSQQSAEKYLKARLTEAGIAFGKTHNLIALLASDEPKKVSMSLKFHDYNGTEVRIPDSTAFTDMVRTKRILSDTLLFDDQTGLWKRASEYPEYHSAISSQQTAAPSYGAPVMSGLASFGQPDDEEATGKVWPLTLALAILLGAMVVVGLTLIGYSRSPVEALTRLLIVLGGAMAAAVISFLVWLLLLRNRKDMGLLFFSCSFLVIALGHYALTAREARSRKLAVERVGTTMTELLNGNRVEALKIDEDIYGSSTPFVKYKANIPPGSAPISER
jgi:hypothetical protein